MPATIHSLLDKLLGCGLNWPPTAVCRSSLLAESEVVITMFATQEIIMPFIQVGSTNIFPYTLFL